MHSYVLLHSKDVYGIAVHPMHTNKVTGQHKVQAGYDLDL